MTRELPEVSLAWSENRVSNFDTFVQQLQPSRLVETAAMKKGVEMEGMADLSMLIKRNKAW